MSGAAAVVEEVYQLVEFHMHDDTGCSAVLGDAHGHLLVALPMMMNVIHATTTDRTRRCSHHPRRGRLVLG